LPFAPQGRLVTLSVSLRITILWVLLFVGGLVLFALLTTASVEREQKEALDADLAAQASTALEQVRLKGLAVAPAGAVSDVPDLGVAVMRQGRVLYQLGTRLPPSVLSTMPKLAAGRATTIHAPAAYRVYPVIGPGNSRIVAAAPEYGLDEEAERVRNGFIVASIPILIFVALTGWYLARRSLAPIAHITALADDIARSHALSKRLELRSDDELGRLAQTFNRMIDELQRSFERERAFIGDISHELRNAIGAVAAESELALGRVREPTDYQAALQIISARTRRIAAVIDDLLLLARADAGILETSQSGEMNEIVSTACSDVQKRESGGTIRLQLSEEQLKVAGSPELLLRLMDNVVVNARRLAHSMVEVSVGQSGAAAVVTVDDDGPGLPPAEREAVFRRFHRSTAEYGGSGLGLAIAAAIVSAYGGTIVVDDAPIGGARFVISLPLREEFS
jgi:signal transduction histidine kinase